MFIDNVPRVSNDSEELSYWIATNEKPWIFPYRSIVKAWELLGSMSGIWTSSHTMLQEAGLDEKGITMFEKLKKEFEKKRYANLIEALHSRGVKILTAFDSDYPQQLRTIERPMGPPLVLFHKGTTTDFSNCAAIVGTRNCSFYGRSMARKLSRVLAEKGYTIVSGLARGADIEAHCGALEYSRGKTIAVLAWFDPIYPDEHSELAHDIQRRGAILSENYEKELGSKIGAKFIERNRITSGLSKFLIAIESDTEGGTVQQIRTATQQNRLVFVLVPKENDRAQRGFESFRDLNAIPFKTADELLEKLKEHKLSPDTNPTLKQFYDNSVQNTLG